MPAGPADSRPARKASKGAAVMLVREAAASTASHENPRSLPKGKSDRLPSGGQSSSRDK